MLQVVKHMGKKSVKYDSALDLDRKEDDGLKTVDHSNGVIEIVD